MLEYYTTYGMAEPSTGYAESPHEPPGDGWQLVGTAACPTVELPGRVWLFWSWQRNTAIAIISDD